MNTKSRKFSIIGNFFGMAVCLILSLQEFANARTPWIYMISTFLFFFSAVIYMSLEAQEKKNKV